MPILLTHTPQNQPHFVSRDENRPLHVAGVWINRIGTIKIIQYFITVIISYNFTYFEFHFRVKR